VTPVEKGIVGCLLLVVLLAASMPVAFVMAIVGFVGFAWVVNTNASLSMVATNLFDTFTNDSLTVIPLFVFMGQIAFHSGISRRFVKTAYAWLGTLPGGLGWRRSVPAWFRRDLRSGPATAATMASVALPEMKRYKYSMEQGAGAVAAAAAWDADPAQRGLHRLCDHDAAIDRKLFIAGIVPACSSHPVLPDNHVHCRLARTGPGGDPLPFAKKSVHWAGGRNADPLCWSWAGCSPGLTPTQARPSARPAASHRGGQAPLTRRMLRSLSHNETVRTSCMVMIIVAGANIFSRFPGRPHVNPANWPNGCRVAHPRLGRHCVDHRIFSGSRLFHRCAGAGAADHPIFHPVIEGLGYDPIWIGRNRGRGDADVRDLAAVGVNVYVVSGVERDLPLQTIFKARCPFWRAVVSAILLVAFPQISLLLPSLVK
jgi:hypothetical protein